MSRPLGIKQKQVIDIERAQVSALVKGAKDAGCVALVQVGDEWKRLDEVYPPCLVYVIRCEQFVKIGKTTQKENRIASMQTANPFELVVLAIIDADDGNELERDLHKRFARYRHRGEWFKDTGWLANWIRRGCPI